MKCFDRNQLLRILPYGEKFLFLDEGIVLDSENHGRGTYIVPLPEDNEIIRCHFPDLPLFPGHLQMEAVAQLAALVFLVKYGTSGKMTMPVLTTSYGELNTIAQPGDVIGLYANVIVKGKKVEVSGRVEVGSNVSHVLMEGMAIPLGILARRMRKKEDKPARMMV